MRTLSYILLAVFCIVLIIQRTGLSNLCHSDRIYLNLFKVNITNNTYINDVKEFLSTHGFQYNGPILSCFHSFILQSYTVQKECSVDRGWLKGIQHEAIISIDQDFQRWQHHSNRLMQAATSGRQRNHSQNVTRQSSGRVQASVAMPIGWSVRRTVKIAVVDNGFQMDHPNLVHAINKTISYDFNNDDDDPSENSGLKADDYHSDRDDEYISAGYNLHSGRDIFIRASHGTANMGIIACQAGSGCNRGINPNIQLVGIQISKLIVNPSNGLNLVRINTASDTAEAKALTHLLDNIEIVSASYGTSDNTGFSDIGEAAKEALRVGVERGRGCKGRLFLYPSGNGHYDNCNMDGYAKSVHTLTISDVDQNLALMDSKERCPCILAATIVNNKIKRPGINSTCIDGNIGSSYAVPVAAAYMAGMLEVNENLTKRDVEHIVIRTSTRDGFSTSVKWRTNAAGFKYNDRVGFGLINPQVMQKMKRMAERWLGVPDVIQCDIPVDGSNITIKDGNSEIRYLEHVEMELSLCCQSCFEKYFGMLSIDVHSPMGTKSSLLTKTNISKDGDEERERRCMNWIFMTYEFWGESPIGPWSISWNNDNQEGLSVTPRVLILRGTKTDPTIGREKPKQCPQELHDEDIPASGSKRLDWIVAVLVVFLFVIVLISLGLHVLKKIRTQLHILTRVSQHDNDALL